MSMPLDYEDRHDDALESSRRETLLKAGALQDAIFNSAYFSSIATDERLLRPISRIRKDGSRLPAMVSVTALRDAAGAIIGYLLIGTDNTVRRRRQLRRGDGSVCRYS
ncbi:MAG TPA: PAS domain-containing protein [Candidatus Cybelea sp.]|nr:PAS domain-containing protein [Candidatus Cybelea sp.]